MRETLALPGFVNTHSHTFQRALRGRAGGGDFWAWRELMLAEAERQTVDTVRTGYAAAYAEMRGAGYTAVGEFHYLGLEEARATAEAAAEADVVLVLLLGAYAEGGLPRMRQDSPADYLRQLESLRAEGLRVGLAPHSVRAWTTVTCGPRQAVRSRSSIGRQPWRARHSSTSRGCSSAWMCSGSLSAAAYRPSSSSQSGGHARTEWGASPTRSPSARSDSSCRR